MAKKFNVTAVCMPDKHYMVNIEERLRQIKDLVDEGLYFTINRARQYGKTTTLLALEQYLRQDYHVVSLDFQTFGSEEFTNENIFALSFAGAFIRQIKSEFSVSSEQLKKTIMQVETIVEDERKSFRLLKLFEKISDICAQMDKPVVLMIDEVDSAANNQVFLDFLAQLRAYYIRRTTWPTFKSVILAGVYDIKNLVRKLRPDEEHKVNSPWNIAADFGVEMSLTKEGIAEMLREYKVDYQLDMNENEMADLLYSETSGYPFLVSKLCKLMDEEISKAEGGRAQAWTVGGFMDALRILTAEKNTLYESIVGKVITYPELNDILQDKIFNGQTVAYTATNPVIDLAAMFGIIKNIDGVAVPANKIFAKVLSDYYLSLDEMKNLEIYKASQQEKVQFIRDGKLNMRLVIERFAEHFTDIYGKKGEKFVEKEGRKYFLLYLKPIINGRGHYSLEAVTTSENRTDLIVYYQKEFFIIEMKIWRGAKKHKDGEKQLLGYMDEYHQETGYLITFNFNKTKSPGIKEIRIDKKTLIEAVI